jgi:phospholipid/cholesterol/gamma-HCH transport system permease protein
MMLRIVNQIGGYTINLAGSVGRLFIFIMQVIIRVFQPPIYIDLLLKQIITIGFYSLPVVAMTTFFSGAVLALQSYNGFVRFSAESSIATVVVLSVTRELGPVLAGLMVAGRIGAAIASEIATMRVTEQIDALYTLSIDSLKYLVVPRVLASVISLPCLVLVGDVIGVMGGYVVSVYKLGFNNYDYITSTLKYLEFMDVMLGLIKAVTFGFIIGIISCYSGYYAGKGARGVGSATTFAVANSSILMLLCNYIVTELFV